MRIKPLLIAALVVMSASSAWAQAPALIPVQGTLFDTDGSPLDGNVSITFAIYADEDATGWIWREIQVVSIDDGLFTVYLGAVDEDLDLDIFRDHTTLYLGITLAGNEMPQRIRLATTGFAAFAEYSESATTLDGLAPGSFAMNFTAGDGLVLGGDRVLAVRLAASGGLSFDGGQLQVDSAQIQAAIDIDGCPVGQAIRIVGADGNLTCQAVGTGTGGGGTINSVVAEQDGGLVAETDLEGNVTISLEPHLMGLTVGSLCPSGEYFDSFEVDSESGDLVLDGEGNPNPICVRPVTTVQILAESEGLNITQEDGTATISFDRAYTDLLYSDVDHSHTFDEILGYSPANPEIVYDSGWFSFPFFMEEGADPADPDDEGGGPVRIAHGLSLSAAELADFFVFGMVRGNSPEAGLITTTAMGSFDSQYHPSYVGYDSDHIYIYGREFLLNISSEPIIEMPVRAEESIVRRGEIRLIGVKRTATSHRIGDARTGLIGNHSATIALNGFPTFVTFELSNTTDFVISEPGQWIVPAMSAATYSSEDGGLWHQASITKVILQATQHQVDFSMENADALTSFYTGPPPDFGDPDATPQPIRKTGLAGDAARYRLRVFDWLPDYDSGWVEITTRIDSSRFIQLNQIRQAEHASTRQQPRLFFLWVADAPDCTNWCLPAMGSSSFNGRRSIGVTHLSDSWVIIGGGTDSIANFFEGVEFAPTTGAYRFFAWD